MEISTHLSFYTQLSVNNLSITYFCVRKNYPLGWAHFMEANVASQIDGHILLICSFSLWYLLSVMKHLLSIYIHFWVLKNRKKEVLLYRSLYFNTNMDHYTKLTEFYRDFNPAKLLEEEIKHSTLWNSSSQPHKQNTINTLYHFH